MSSSLIWIGYVFANTVFFKIIFLSFFTKERLEQGWPTFWTSGPNFRYKSLGGPKISSKKIWGAKKKHANRENSYFILSLLMIYVIIWVCNQKEPYLLVPNYYFIPTVCSLLVNVINYPTVITLSCIYCTVCILKNLCRAIQKSLAGQKWPAGPSLAAPALIKTLNCYFPP